MEITLVLNRVELVACVDSAEAVVLAVAMGELNREAFTNWVKAHHPTRYSLAGKQEAPSQLIPLGRFLMQQPAALAAVLKAHVLPLSGRAWRVTRQRIPLSSTSWRIWTCEVHPGSDSRVNESPQPASPGLALVQGLRWLSGGSPSSLTSCPPNIVKLVSAAVFTGSP